MTLMKFSAVALTVLVSLAKAATEAPLDPVAETVTVTRPIVSPLSFGLDLKYRPIQFPGLSSANGHGGQLALEYLPAAPYKHYVGKPAIGLSAGFGKIPNIGSGVSFTTLPVSAYLAYRLDFLDNQILVPFGKIGRSVTFTHRGRGGNGRYQSWDYSLGGQLCLNSLDSRSARNLDTEIGINNTYLIVEWVKSSAADGVVQDDLSHEEWQIGLRFEM